MIELKITGETAMEFFQKAMEACLLLAKGGEALMPRPIQQLAPEVQPETSTTISTSFDDTFHHDTAETPAEPKTRRGRKPKPVETIEPPVVEPAPEITIEAIRKRIREIGEKHAARGNDREKCIAYVRKLFSLFPFDDTRPILKTSELNPEQYGEFWKASEAYLDGGAPA